MMIGLKVEEFFRRLSAPPTALTSHGVAPAAAFRARLERLIQHRRSNASVRSNTSGNQVNLLAQCAMPNWKRAVDILGSVLGLVILSPLFLIVSILIKTVSKGPLFFRQERVGYGGRVFHLWKFRTYEVDADTAQHRDYLSSLINASQQQADTPQPPMTKLDHVPGIIPLGKLLRKTCIDELPQLINVLLGQMSLVGPRPPIAYEVEQYADWHRGRLDAVPGMTGLWQVSGKNRLTFNEMVRLDIQYSRRKSFCLDTRILLKTPIAITSQIIDTLAKRMPETAEPLEFPATVKKALAAVAGFSSR